MGRCTLAHTSHTIKQEKCWEYMLFINFAFANLQQHCALVQYTMSAVLVPVSGPAGSHSIFSDLIINIHDLIYNINPYYRIINACCLSIKLYARYFLGVSLVLCCILLWWQRLCYASVPLVPGEKLLGLKREAVPVSVFLEVKKA